MFGPLFSRRPGAGARRGTTARAPVASAPTARAVADALEGRVLFAGGLLGGLLGPVLDPLLTLPRSLLQRTVGSALASLSADYESQGGRTAGGGFTPRESLLRVVDGRVAIQARAILGNGLLLETQLRLLGATDVRAAGRTTHALLPLGSIDLLAALPTLDFARPVWATTRAGAATSQGEAATRADVARATYGVDGTGVKVGILSDSFDAGSAATDYADDVLSGDLPSGVSVLQDYPVGNDEGRAMAQLVHDAAPGASLAFATAYYGQAGFADNIRALRDAGADVIVDDVLYLDEPMFQDGVIAQAVDEVVCDGVAYFSAAGNAGRRGYESAFNPGNARGGGSIASAVPGFSFSGGLTHDFDPDPGAVDDLQHFTLAPGESVYLSFQWDQPYSTTNGLASGPGSSSDLDVYVLNAAGNQVLAGSADDNMALDPVEVFSFTNTGGVTADYNLMIANYGGPNPGLMKYVDYAAGNFTEFTTDSGTVTGHANSAGAIAVAAAAWHATPAFGVDPAVVRPDSSAGRTPILFDATGTRLLTPAQREAPVVTAPTGGNNTFFGPDAAEDADALPNFYGTSAAAPEAAAVAALMLEARPSLTPAEVRDTLAATALDMDDPLTPSFDAGYDDATGFGLVRADAALAALYPRVTSVAVNGGSPQRSMVTSITVTFDRAVTPAAGAFEIVRRSDSAVVGVTATSPDDVTWTLTFGGATTNGAGSLNDGIYDLTVNAADVLDAGAQPMAADHAFAFHRLYSDADGDGDSDSLDLSQFRQSLNKSSSDPGFVWYFDYEPNAVVDGADLTQLRNRRLIVYAY